MKLPPDIDRLAWSVAESGEPRLRAEFAKRHPEFKEEMERRAALVDDRGHTPAHASAGIALPVCSAPVPMWASVLAGLAVGALAVSLFIPRSEAAEPQASVMTAPASGTLASTGVSLPTLPTGSNRRTPANSLQDIPPVSTASPTRTPNLEAEQTMRLEGTALHDALELIAEAGGLNIRVDPDIPDPEVRQELANLTPREMISRLGSEYGFRVVEEAPGSLVLVPLGEPTPQQEETPEPPEEATPPDTSNGSEGSEFPIFANGNR